MSSHARPPPAALVAQIRKGTAPKYGLMAETLRQRIAHGAWPQGTYLPSLHALAQEFGVARLTARQAVQLLVQDGLLESVQGRGTFITGQHAAAKAIQVQTTLQSLSDMYVRNPPEIRTLDEQVVHLPAHLGDPSGRPFVRMRRVHSDGGVAYCVIAVHIDQKVFRRASNRFRKNAAIPVLVALLGQDIVRAHQTLTVRTLDAQTASLLEVPANSAGAYVERSFEGAGGQVLYYAEVVYRGDLVKLEIDLKV